MSGSRFTLGSIEFTSRYICLSGFLLNYQFQNYVMSFMKYLDLLWAIDFLYRYYPKYHSNELLLLADDILKWINNELPEDSSALIYLKSCFDSPYEALTKVWNEVLLLAGPFSRSN